MNHKNTETSLKAGLCKKKCSVQNDTINKDLYFKVVETLKGYY